MTHSTLRSLLWVTALVASCVTPSAAAAQGRSHPKRVVSIDPSGMVNRRLTAEAEFCSRPGPDAALGCLISAGLATTVERHPRLEGSKAARQHVDAEGFIRLGDREYLTGWWIGLRTALTYADRYGVRPSLGAETGLSRLISRRYYAGASVGVKKVFFLDDASDLRYNPTLRLAAGFAF